MPLEKKQEPKAAKADEEKSADVPDTPSAKATAEVGQPKPGEDASEYAAKWNAAYKKHKSGS